ncbi:MAG TPA: hypothetical protein VE959_28470 [Bryobacteraceae bacterium]|nr:hypothetical protein [Bryobacteraceae bacterium]
MHHILKLCLVVLLALPAFSQRPNQPRAKPQVDSTVGIGNGIITHVADGGGWTTSITLINLSETKAAAFTLNFYGDNGNPQPFSFQGTGKASTLTGTLVVGGSLVIKTTGAGAATQGWAQFDYLSTTDSVGGFAVFTNSNGNEAAVPFETDLSENSILSFDNTNGYGMGIALANSDFSTVTINATFRDGNGAILGTDRIAMASMTHTSFVFAQQWPFTAGRQGTVYFQCSDAYGPNAFGLAILGLRFTPQGAFTSVTSFQQWTVD